MVYVLLISFKTCTLHYNEFLKNHRLGIEGTFPIFQKYRGIQMKEVFKIVIGWQYSF